MRPSITETLSIRGLRYNVRRWGRADAPTVFFLHGWMDSSPTFQFLVDALQHEWRVIAPDWRGFGLSDWLGRPYWFPDYYADLDALLAHYTPDAPAQIVGHSMGASIAAGYAAVRPERVARFVMLDFLGLKFPEEVAVPDQVLQWLNELRGAPQLRVYPDTVALARRLMAADPLLVRERAEFLSKAVSRLLPEGGVQMACDPWHKVASPQPYRIDDVLTTWQRIQCPVLHVFADQGFVAERFSNDETDLQRRLACFTQAQVHWIADAGHNLHHHQPGQVAALLEAFLQR